jgi:hypothetical protein
VYFVYFMVSPSSFYSLSRVIDNDLPRTKEVTVDPMRCAEMWAQAFVRTPHLKENSKFFLQFFAE